jgi:superfamily II DNA helicase RecQ
MDEFIEIGRAGRDNQPTKCILFTSSSDALEMFTSVAGGVSSACSDAWQIIHFMQDLYTCRAKQMSE